MSRGINRLSAADLRRKEPGTYGDGNNLYLQVSVSKTNSKQINRSWVFRYSAAKTIEMGLGSAAVVGLKEAREQAREYCALRLRGIDPKQHRDDQLAAAKAASMKSITFEAAAHSYIAAHRDEWRSEQHAQEWPRSLAKYVFPTLGSLPVAMIDTPLVVKALESAWDKVPETAARLRGRVESILDWCAVSGFRSGDNPARWSGHLEYLLAAPRKRRVEHLPAMPWRELPAFMEGLRAIDNIAARALEFCVLAAARTGEVRSAVWDDIDVHTALWSVPAERMKSGREHRVPLSPRCMQILKGMQHYQGQHVFPGIRWR
jgi:integrase